MVRLVSTTFLLGALVLLGCKDSTPPGPSTEEFSKARQERAAELKKGEKKKKVVSKKPKQPQAAEGEESSFAAVERGYRYDPRGKRDPFRSYQWEQLRLELTDQETRGPLEQFDVNQLTVVGLVWNDRNARALVEDPAGMSYIIGEGARIGKNDGRVTRIGDNLVVVRETYVDYLGEETTKDVEMRVRATEGG
jgi:Tfp pilus assembly protein PilP